MVCICQVLLLKISHKIFLNLNRSVGIVGHQSQSVAHSENMCVNSHCRQSEPYCPHHIGCFSAYTRQGSKTLHVCRYFPMEIPDKYSRHFHKMSGF